MIFPRSQPKRHYRDYLSYRSLLRRDFQHRCAYCLAHEFFLGGEANFCIDHHHPIKGSYGRPDLIAVYSNLYWCCRECNENKADTWPTPSEYAQGYRFLDPCNPEDDHDLHWRTLPDGSLTPLTVAGEYTIDCLQLWRPQLQYYRGQEYEHRIEIDQVTEQLREKGSNDEHRRLLERRLQELRQWLEPPVFDRPRSR